MMTKIELAVLPLKNDAVERARQEGEKEVQYVRDELAKNDGDINKAAPYPRTTGLSALYGTAYHTARSRYSRFHGISVEDQSRSNSHRVDDPHYVTVCPEKSKRYVEQRMLWAAEDYDAFVRKLVAKIGDTTDAYLIGNHVWGYSTLIVTKPGGEKQAWKTQQITNHSKLGKPFLQWPSRRLKSVPKEALAA